MTSEVARRSFDSFGRLRPGSRLAGYLIEEQVGAGGMAVVFRARDEALGRLAAVKVIAPSMADDDEFRARFLRESRAAAAVDSPYIVPVYEAGEADGLLYIATRFVAGGDLAGLLRRDGGRLATDRAASLVSQVASALDAAHAAGLVHRDVKPKNILVDVMPGRPEHAYLADFGLSKGTQSTALTATGQFLGTPDYSSPEQIRGGRLDGRADEYSLGCVAFVLLTGSLPFRRNDAVATLFAHLEAPIPLVTALRPDLPAAVNGVIARALAKSPGARYRTCGEFAAALRDALTASGRTATAVRHPWPSQDAAFPVSDARQTWHRPTAGPEWTPPATLAPATTPRPRWTRRRSRMALAGAAAALILAAGGVIYAVVSPGTSSPGRPAKPTLAATLTVPDGGTVESVWFSPDGKLMAASPVVGAKIYIWNTVSKSYVTTVTAPDMDLSKSDHRIPAILNVAFSADDSTLTVAEVPHASSGDPGMPPDGSALGRPVAVYQWDLGNGNRTTLASFSTSAAGWFLISGDNSTVAIAGSPSAPNGVEVESLAPVAGSKARQTIPINSVPIGIDNSGARIDINNTVIWDTSRGKKIAQFNYGGASTTLSPDGKTMYVVNSGGATLWAIGAKPGLTPASATPADPRWGQQLANLEVNGRFSSDGGVIATIRFGGEMDLWSTATGKYLLTITDPNYHSDSGYPLIGPGGSEAVILGSPAHTSLGRAEYRQIDLWQTPLTPPRVTGEP
jgi:serine/threonine-protein kinase